MAEGGGNKLSEEQIFECLKSLNVPVRMNDLKSPTREFIIRVFECFLKDLQIDISNPVLTPWTATKHFEDGAEMYEEGQFLCILALSMNRIISYTNLSITLKDIVEPRPKRTKKILNFLLVFWNYYLQMYGRFNVVEETFEIERKKREDLIHENESLDEKKAEKLNILQNMEPSREELQQINAAKEEKAAKLMKESDDLLSEYTKLKTKEFNLKQQISAAHLEIVKATETFNELSQLILSSPKQKLINTQIKTLEEKIKEIDAKAKECESVYKDEMKKVQLLEEYQKDEEKLKKSLNDMEEIDKQLSATVKAIVDVQQQINDVEDKLKRLKMDLERKEDWQHQQEQKSAKLNLKQKKQLETLRELLKMNRSEETKVKSQLEYVTSAIQDVQDSMDSDSKVVLDVLETCKRTDTKIKEREAQFKSKLREIADLFKLDCDEIMENMEGALPYESEDGGHL